MLAMEHGLNLNPRAGYYNPLSKSVVVTTVRSINICSSYIAIQSNNRASAAYIIYLTLYLLIMTSGTKVYSGSA